MSKNERPEEAWSDSLSAAWEERRRRTFERHRRVSEWLVNAIAPQPGDTLLELAAGPGETGFLAAERIGPTGKLISTDLAPGMVEAAARGAKAMGLSNVDTRVMNAQHIDLSDGSVDGVLCRFGLMLMPEPQLAMRESRRVLRPAGHLAYAVFGSYEGNPWITMLVDAFAQCGHQIPDDIFEPAGPFFSLASSQRNQNLMTSAGFASVRVEEINEVRMYDGFDEYWDHHTHTTGPIATLAASLSDDEAESIRVALRPKLAPFQGSSGYEVPSNGVVVDGT
jgi:ubiquinone/menaquinone biosynthesis C-methylase UbiE